MTSGLDVPRWTNSYGRKNLNRLVGSSYQMVKPITLPPTNTSTTRSVAESVRLVPVKGVVRPDGFKMPTAWSSFATRANYKPYLYLATTGPYAYYFSGEGYDANHGVGNFPGVTLSDTIVIVSVPTMMQSQARLEAMLKLRDQEIDVGTALGESKATLSHLSSSVTRLIRAYRAARRGRWSHAFQILGLRGKRWKDTDHLADAWLEYSYGWMPLISDIYGAQEQLKKGFREADQLFSVSRQISDGLNPRDFISPASVAQSPYLKIGGKAGVYCRVKYYAKINNATLYALNQLGLTNPLAVAWELVPFSFVVDWLLPIGDFLNGLTATVGVDFVTGIQSNGRFCRVNWTWSDKAPIQSPAFGYRHSQGTVPWVSWEGYATQRIVLSSWGWVLPYVTSPFSTNHTITTIALVKSLSR